MKRVLIRIEGTRLEQFEVGRGWEKTNFVLEHYFHNYKIVNAGNKSFLVGGKMSGTLTSPCVAITANRIEVKSPLLE
jgi:hypothetical protein